MTGCDAVRTFLEDAALGGKLPNAARLHFMTCADCAGELERRRATVQQLDVVLRARANAQLPSDLDARVLASVRRAAPPRARALWPAAAAFALGVVVLALIARTAFTAQPNPAPLISWQSPTAALLQPVK